MADKHKNIVWLASYPKSGNTWFRVFLANLIEKNDKPVDINSLGSIPIASSRSVFDRITGLSSADLRHDEINRLRPAVYEKMALQSKNSVFLKIHDAFIKNIDGNNLIPEHVSKGIIYFIRNPLDVAVSFAHHSGISVNRMAPMMNDSEHAFCSKEDRLYNQLTQKLLTWSGHVKSWTEQKKIPVHILKYEDMCADSFATFKKAVSFAGLIFDDKDIEKALKYSSFDELQRQEQQNGFAEKSSKSKMFFRKGKTGSWREEMNDEQIEIIVKAHKELMIKYGYLDNNGNILS